MEHEVTEQWRLGKVEINKLVKGFTYLDAAGLAVPPLPTNTLHNKPPKPPRQRVEKVTPWAWHMRKRQESEAEHAVFEATLAKFQANMAILD